MTTAFVEQVAAPQLLPSKGASCQQLQMTFSGATQIAGFTATLREVIRLTMTEDSAAETYVTPYETPATPSNEQLLALAKTHAPPQEWFEGEEERFF